MKPSTLKCLRLLRANESVTTHDFLVGGCGSRFGARLAELRHEYGCIIDEHKLSDRSGSRYTLLAEPSTTSPGVLSPAGEPPAPNPPSARATSSNSAGVTGSGDDQARVGGVTADSERDVAVEKPRPPARLFAAQCAVDDDWDWEAA